MKIVVISKNERIVEVLEKCYSFPFPIERIQVIKYLRQFQQNLIQLVSQQAFPHEANLCGLIEYTLKPLKDLTDQWIAKNVVLVNIITRVIDSVEVIKKIDLVIMGETKDA